MSMYSWRHPGARLVYTNSQDHEHSMKNNASYRDAINSGETRRNPDGFIGRPANAKLYQSKKTGLYHAVSADKPYISKQGFAKKEDAQNFSVDNHMKFVEIHPKSVVKMGGWPVNPKVEIYQPPHLDEEDMNLRDMSKHTKKILDDQVFAVEPEQLDEATETASDQFTKAMRAHPVLSKHFSSVPYNKDADRVHHHHKTAEHTRLLYTHDTMNPYPHKVEIQGYDFSGHGHGKDIKSAIADAHKEYNAKHKQKTSQMEAQLAGHKKTYLD